MNPFLAHVLACIGSGSSRNLICLRNTMFIINP